MACEEVRELNLGTSASLKLEKVELTVFLAEIPFISTEKKVPRSSCKLVHVLSATKTVS